jgi:ATP-dependent Clp protease adaptor protein ClpS
MDEQRTQTQTTTAIATATAERPKSGRPPLDKLPLFKVLLHNDDVNSLDHVVDSVVELTPLSQQEATLAAMEADKTGLSLLMTTHKERAELYQEQLTSKSLTVTIEPEN